jgi:hypothetical protein
MKEMARTSTLWLLLNWSRQFWEFGSDALESSLVGNRFYDKAPSQEKASRGKKASQDRAEKASKRKLKRVPSRAYHFGFLLKWYIASLATL